MMAASPPPPTSSPHLSALLEAVHALPSDGEPFEISPKLLASAGLSNQPHTARAFVCHFAAWARAYASKLPLLSQYEATDFNDYYKLVMSRVQYIYARCTDDVAQGPLSTFQTHLRARPQFTSREGDTRTLCVLDLDADAVPAGSGSYTQCDAKFRAALAAVGARCFRAQTLRLLLASRCTRIGQIEESLGCMSEEWIAALDGSRLFTLLPPGAEFSNSTHCEVKVVIYGRQAVVLARGPWWRVTFVETAILQCICQFMTDEVNARSKNGAVGWNTEALISFALWAHQVERRVHGPKRGRVSFFSGRRAPSAPFHLLQHMYLSTLWGHEFTTSSCLAARVLAPLGRPQELIGTSAHEGPMAFMALFSELDTTVPVSSLMWTILFWATTSNASILTDAYGSATFKQMLSDVGLLDEVSMARQDSGRLDRFKEIFSSCTCMASEVEKFADIEEAMDLGYVAFGVGGALGERRREHKELSVVMKLVEVMRVDRATGGPVVSYAGKLGDCSYGGGSWARYKEDEDGGKARSKFITSIGADSSFMFDQLVRWASMGDRQFDAGVAAALVPRSDALALAVAIRRIASGEWLRRPQHAHIRDRMGKYATIVEQAAVALVPAASPAPRKEMPKVVDPLEMAARGFCHAKVEEEEEWLAREDGSFIRASDPPSVRRSSRALPALPVPDLPLSDSVTEARRCSKSTDQLSLQGWNDCTEVRHSGHMSDEDAPSTGAYSIWDDVKTPHLSPLTQAERSWLASEVASLAGKYPPSVPERPGPHKACVPAKLLPPSQQPALSADSSQGSNKWQHRATPPENGNYSAVQEPSMYAISTELQRSYEAFMESARRFAHGSMSTYVPQIGHAPQKTNNVPVTTSRAMSSQGGTNVAACSQMAEASTLSADAPEQSDFITAHGVVLDAESLASYDTYIVSCEGVLWGVARPVADRAVSVVNSLIAMRKRLLFVTNDSKLTRKACVTKLERVRVNFGCRRHVDRIAMCVTSSHTAALYLRAMGLYNPFVVASDGALLEELRSVGIHKYHATVLDSGEPRRDFVSAKQDAAALARVLAAPWARRVDSIVVTSDDTFSARKVAVVVNLLNMADEAGKPPPPLIACASDRGHLLGTSDGKSGLPVRLRAMGNGSMAEAISQCFEPTYPWIDMGKPSDVLFDLIVNEFEVDVSHALLIGDGLSTDIAFGNGAGMATLLVLSGSTTYAQAEAAFLSAHSLVKPTYVLSELGTFAKELQAIARLRIAQSLEAKGSGTVRV